jgi:5-formyltetrahydrofolate cyclo-ligase
LIWLYARFVSQAPDIIEEKRALRLHIKTWRAGLTADARARAAQAIAAHGLSFLQLGSKRHVVSGFSSLPEEFRAWPLLRRLHAEGHLLAMPVMQGKNLPLLFRAWTPGDAMKQAVWGIAEPTADKPALQPDIVLAPLLAFDASGWRLGYGGGYYDRTLRALRALKAIVAVGLAYDEQQVDAVPHLDTDERLDWVLRPSGPLRCGE